MIYTWLFFLTQVITRGKAAMRPYSILAKNDSVDVALRLAHHTDKGAVDRLVLWADNAYVTQWELDNASSEPERHLSTLYFNVCVDLCCFCIGVSNLTLVIRRRHCDSRGLIRKCQADHLADAIPNARHEIDI